MLTQSYLQSILNYNLDTGIFIWKHNNKIAGTKHRQGYIHISVNNKKYAAHRLAWIYIYGSFPKYMIDHVNGIKSDNKIINIREATANQNQHNKSLNKNNTSSVKGVHWCDLMSKWQARICVNTKRINFGYFDSLEFAELVIQEARMKYHGNFARNI